MPNADPWQVMLPPHDPSVLVVDGVATTELLALVLVDEVLVAVEVEGMPVKVPAAHVAIAGPADRYQFAFGSPRQVPTVTGAPQPDAFMESRMNCVRL